MAPLIPPLTRLRWYGAILGAAGSMVGWLPWLYVGAGRRDSYGLFRAAERLGFDELAPARVVWYLVPVLGLAVVLMAVVGHSRAASLFLTVQSVIVAGVASAVIAVGASPGVSIGWGPWLAAVVGGAGFMFGVVWPLVPQHRR